MKVFICADIEGISGLVAWSQCGGPNSQTFDWRYARERMTADVNAAIRGAKKGGATEVVVKDSHGLAKNLLISDLEAPAQLISGIGSHPDGMMAGIDASFQAAMLIGYHAMAGTQAGIMEHTISGLVHRMWINGVESGELALSAMVAGSYGVPVAVVSSDRKGCEEAQTFLTGTEVAAVKEGFGRYMGKCLHPVEAERLIESAAQKGAQRAGEINPWLPDSPTTITIEFNRSEEADSAELLLGVTRKDAYTVEQTLESPLRAHQGARQLISMAGLGSNANK